MKAVIMAGGFGTRLRPITTHLPKPLVPIGNVPIMEHTVRLLKRHGFTDLVVLLYFLPETIIAHSGDVLTDFDLSAAVAFHRDCAAEATMVLTRVDSPLAYGIVITDPAGRVIRFLEKPTWGEVFSD